MAHSEHILQSLSRKGGQRPRPANWVAAGSSPAVLPSPDPKNQPGKWGWQTQLEQNWARGRQAARKQRWCRRPGFRRQQLAPQGAELTMRDVVPSPMPEVLFLLAKGGNRGKTIQWCPAAHTATKDLVHLKKKPRQTNPNKKQTTTPTTLKSFCRYHRQLLAQSSSSQLLLPMTTLLFYQHQCACYLGQLGLWQLLPPPRISAARSPHPNARQLG